MKTALVTGGSRSIGAQCVRALASDGYRTIINYNSSEEDALSLASEVGGLAIRADVSNPADVQRMFDEAGEVDVLVCNAGISHFGLFDELSLDAWRRIFAVNVEGVFSACKCAAKGMISRKSGRIITISSIWGITGASCEVAYSASKAAVIGFTKALAKELGPSGITVNCIAPGVIDTAMNAVLTPETLEALKEETPLGRLGSTQDVAALVAFLASERSGFITGQVISPNGGILI